MTHPYAEHFPPEFFRSPGGHVQVLLYPWADDDDTSVVQHLGELFDALGQIFPELKERGKTAPDLGWLDELLSGIDKDECDDDAGWWPTGTGAEYGAAKLAALKAEILRRYHS